MSTTHLTLSWGISRGHETYGYNIRRLVDDSTGKRYRCMGGGYDMTGTVLAEWLCEVHQNRLRAIGDRAYYRGVPGPTTTHEDGLYGMRQHDDGSIYVDGGCGLSSVERIMRAAGLAISWVRNRRSGDETAAIVSDGAE